MKNASRMLALGCLLAACPPAAAQDGGADQPSRGWIAAGGDIADSHAGHGEIILNRFDVPYLRQRWAVSTSGSVSATPAVIGRDLYVPDDSGSLYRIDTLTGRVVWQKKISDYSGVGTSYSRTTPAISGHVLVIGDRTQAVLFAIDRFSGALLWRRQLDTAPGAIITGSAVIAGGRVYAGVSSNQESLATNLGFTVNFRGQVAALDLTTGALIWQFRTVPEGYTGGAVWSSGPAVDPRRGTLYVSVGNNYTVPQSVEACQLGASTPEQQQACASPDDHFDSVLALDLSTGRLKWSRTLLGEDAWTVSCLTNAPVGTPCPKPTGPDYDFGAGPNLYAVRRGGRRVDLVGAGQKSGVYWSLDPDDGHTVWASQFSPGGSLGGTLWGAAADGARVYTESGNYAHTQTVLSPSGQTATGGFWSALDARTGAIVWQTPAIGQDPEAPTEAAPAPGSVSVANGVMYGEDYGGYLAALDARDGAVLWRFQAGGSPVAGPAILDGSLYWGTPTRLYAFSPAGRL